MRNLDPAILLLGVISFFPLMAFLVYHLVVIYKKHDKKVSLRQKIIDRCIVVFISGFAAVIVFQKFIDDSMGTSLLSYSKLSLILAIFVGVRSFVSFLLIPIYLEIEKKIQSNQPLNDLLDKALISLMKEKYSSRHISSFGFKMTFVISILCVVVSMFFYTNPTEQIILSYSILTFLPEAFVNKEMGLVQK